MYGFVIENGNTSYIIENDDPTTYLEAIMSSDSDKWFKDIKYEMNFMNTKQDWTLVVLENVTPIGCKWVFKKKIGVDGQVETYKVRLMAKNFR